MEGLDLARLQRLIETSSKRKMSRVVKIEYVVEQERRERRERREMPVPDVVHPWRDGRPATHSTRLNYPRLRKVAHRSSAPLTPDPSLAHWEQHCHMTTNSDMEKAVFW